MVQTFWKTVFQFLIKLNILTIQPSNCSSWYLPKGVENFCPLENLHRDGYNSFIHNCKNLKATNMFFSRWTAVHPDNQILFSATQVWASTSWKDTVDILVHVAKLKKLVWKDYILYDSIPSMILWLWYCGKSRTLERTKGSAVSWDLMWEGKKGWTSRMQRIFRAVKLFCTTLDGRYYAFVKIHRTIWQIEWTLM